MEDMLGRVVKKLEQLSKEMLGTLFDLLEKLAGQDGRMWFEALKRMLRGEQSWGIPSVFKVTTNGRSSDQFLADFSQKDFRLDHLIVEIFQGREFAISGKYRLAVIMGHEFNDDERTHQKIREVAYERGWLDAPVGIVPYLVEMFSEEDFEKTGINTLLVMHEPISGLGGSPAILGINSDLDLNIYSGRPNEQLGRRVGFVFYAPKGMTFIFGTSDGIKVVS